MMMEPRRMIVLALARSVLGAVVAGILWYFRILQVGAFALIAALDSKSAPVISKTENRHWLLNTAPQTHLLSNLNRRVLVSYHPEYHRYDAQMARASLDKAVDLGAGWIRFDVRWYQVLPDGETPNHEALNWYQDFLAAAQQRDLFAFAVLSSPPRAVIREQPIRRLEHWERFVRTVVKELGKQCHGYQLMNEPNNPFYRIFDLPMTAEALVRGASIIRSESANPIAINITADLWGWRSYLSKLLEASGRSVDIVGLDHYPGTWTLGRGLGWESVKEIAGLISSASPGSVWSNRKFALIEAGYSTNTSFRSEADQACYFQSLANAVGEIKRMFPSQGDLLLGVYELVDGNSSDMLDPEAHFGLLKTDLTPKRTYGQVKSMIAEI